MVAVYAVTAAHPEGQRYTVSNPHAQDIHTLLHFSEKWTLCQNHFTLLSVLEYTDIPRSYGNRLSLYLGWRRTFGVCGSPPLGVASSRKQIPAHTGQFSVLQGQWSMQGWGSTCPGPSPINKQWSCAIKRELWSQADLGWVPPLIWLILQQDIISKGLGVHIFK